ncbi:ANTAR domain-containing protein [Kribbella sp. NPDC049174]|uniref:ANTAR domain-containing protein n=1 Tax=Kribbella sp. NPDC049174 TaxID=3364112 RepID=UPI003711E1A7
MMTHDRTIGVLSLYHDKPHAFGDDDEAIALLLAQHAAVAVASARQDETMAQAVDARRLVGQAVGILMERFDIDQDRAFAILRRYSQDTNTRLHDVAQHLIDTRTLPDPTWLASLAVDLRVEPRTGGSPSSAFDCCALVPVPALRLTQCERSAGCARVEKWLREAPNPRRRHRIRRGRERQAMRPRLTQLEIGRPLRRTQPRVNDRASGHLWIRPRSAGGRWRRRGFGVRKRHAGARSRRGSPSPGRARVAVQGDQHLGVNSDFSSRFR